MANLPATTSSEERSNADTRGAAQIYDTNSPPATVNIYDRPEQSRTTGTSVVSLIVLLLVLLVVVYFLLQWIA